MFELAGFPIKEIANLRFQVDPQQPTGQAIEDLFRDIKQRAIFAKSAARGITEEFGAWWIDTRHEIDFNVDGDTFQIWVSDNRYRAPIEFEGRSQGFRWFFTFYLVFTVETDYAHENAVLLLDEPGLHLYIPMQRKLLELFDRLSQNNQVIYTTHSPFMLDSRHLERVRVLEEMEDGLMMVSTDTGRSGDRVVFPVQAHLGYQLAQTLFLARRVLIVEGVSDYDLLIFLSDHLRELGRIAMPEQMAISFAGGNSSVKPLVAMMAPQGFEIVVLLDNDPAGRGAGSTLEKDGYLSFPTVELRYYGDILDETDPFDVEGMLPTDLYLQSIEATHEIELPEIKPTQKQTMSAAVKEYLKTQDIVLDKEAAMKWLVALWSKQKELVPDDLLDKTEAVFRSVHEAIRDMMAE